MTTITKSVPASRLSTPANVLLLIAGAVVALGVNTGLAFGALALGADATFAPLTIVAFGPFTVIGYFLAYLGWRIVRARAARPAAVLRWLVPVLTVLSFTPDVVLLLTGFIPGASLIGGIALALMHLVVVAAVLLVALRVAPVRQPGGR